MIGQSFGTGTHAEMPVSLVGADHSVGVSGIWYQWKNLFATPFYWLIAPIFRRARRTTTAEVVEDRYRSWIGDAYTAFVLVLLTINSASMLKGAAKAIRMKERTIIRKPCRKSVLAVATSQATGGHVPVNGIVVAMSASMAPQPAYHSGSPAVWRSSCAVGRLATASVYGMFISARVGGAGHG
jgi:hypothetical protein